MTTGSEQIDLVPGELLVADEDAFTISFRNIKNLPPGSHISISILTPGETETEITITEEIDSRD